jgi:hypothetical protein
MWKWDHTQLLILKDVHSMSDWRFALDIVVVVIIDFVACMQLELATSSYYIYLIINSISIGTLCNMEHPFGFAGTY